MCDRVERDGEERNKNVYRQKLMLFERESGFLEAESKEHEV